jgi:hypothetical protein
MRRTDGPHYQLNIQSYFAKIEEINVELTHLEQSNYIQTNLYKFYLDPLKNLVVENPTKENIHIRQKEKRISC